MSLPRSATASYLAWAMLATLVIVGHAGSSVVHGQAEDDGPFAAWARWAVRAGPWKGPVVPFPEATPRPAGMMQRVDSLLVPVSVHGGPRVPRDQLIRVLRAAEPGYAALSRAGHPLPPGDGGRGGTAGFDLYLDGTVHGATAAVDAADLTSPYDGAIVHGRLAVGLPDAALAGCVTQAIAEAALLALDPAEAPPVRRASARLAAFYETGWFGCWARDAEMLAAPHRGLGTAATTVGTALFLAMIDERARGGEGRFLYDMWQFTRQRSANLQALRASPNLWEAIERALSNAGQRPADLYVDLAVARYFASGRAGRRAAAPFAVLRTLPLAAAVPLIDRIPRTALPRHIYGPQDLGPLGSAYLEVMTPASEPGAELRVWLRGDQEVHWSLVAVRVSADFQERGRITAPPRDTPSSYLPIVLTQDTQRVVLVVTRLPRGVFDPPAEKAAGPAGFKLIIDYVAPGGP